MMIKKETIAIWLLYGTFAGRLILKIIIRPQLSGALYRYFNSPWSEWIAEKIIKEHGIDTANFEQQTFLSYNSFFTRQLKNFSADNTPNRVISPCDGYLTVYKITPGLTFSVKNTEYSIKRLLKDSQLAERYNGGMCLVFRLAPYNYHRYIYAFSEKILNRRKIQGVLHSVRPIACEKYPVYIENSREYTVIKTENMGVIVQMEVGALFVGRIKNNKDEYAEKGREKGYFEAGGSTVILLTEKDKIALFDNIISNSDRGIETKVNIGRQIGFIKTKNERTDNYAGYYNR